MLPLFAEINDDINGEINNCISGGRALSIYKWINVTLGLSSLSPLIETYEGMIDKCLSNVINALVNNAHKYIEKIDR